MQGTEVPSSVLVVDDEPAVLAVFSRALAQRGLSIRTALNAEEALALVETEGFGCVLADKNLPGVDGIELVRRIRDAQPHCACIVMTAYASKESAVEALRLGAVDYLEKPFDDLDRVATRVHDALRGMRDDYEPVDLRQRSLHLLSRLVASKAAGREVLLSGEGLLEEVDRLRKQGGVADGELARLEQLLRDHLALAKHAQSR